MTEDTLRKIKGYIKNLESKVRELEEATKAKDVYNKNLELRVRELEKTIKIREQTVEDLKSYNKVWRNNWCERVMKNESPLVMEFYSGRMSPETFKKYFETI